MGVELDRELELEEPMVVDGIPGTGLVGKIAAEHLINELEMECVGTVRSPEVPPVMVFHEDDYLLKHPLRIYVDEDRDLMVLNSDIPLSAEMDGVIQETVELVQEMDGIFVHVIGMPVGPSDDPGIFGVSSNGSKVLEEAGISPPVSLGAIGGPAGAFMREAVEKGMGSVALLVESDPYLPDPRAAQVALEDGFRPLKGIDIDTEILERTADEIKRQKERLAEEINEAPPERTSEAFPREMYR